LEREGTIRRRTVFEPIGSPSATSPPANPPVPQTPNVAESPSKSNVSPTNDFDLIKDLSPVPDVIHEDISLTWKSDGVLYEDGNIQIGLKSRYQTHVGQIAIYYGNKTSSQFTSFITTLDVSDPDALLVTSTSVPPSSITSRSQAQQLLHIECKKMFTIAPTLTASFSSGSPQKITVRLPIVITKFITGVKLGQTDFFDRWKLIGGPPRESQEVFAIGLDGTGELDLPLYKKVVTGHHMEVLEDIDPNPHNLVAAGVLHMSIEGKVGCLLRLEPNRDARVSFDGHGYFRALAELLSF
jgi:AP-2 complex subunit alpha